MEDKIKKIEEHIREINLLIYDVMEENPDISFKIIKCSNSPVKEKGRDKFKILFIEVRKFLGLSEN